MQILRRMRCLLRRLIIELCWITAIWFGAIRLAASAIIKNTVKLFSTIMCPECSAEVPSSGYVTIIFFHRRLGFVRIAA